ncbi:hypothetical protein SJ05684_b47930 (plasmid) [Sinorhizobium sojae CCBAU 05684]|uniref:Uncharacterized protein n=1 Tax=Sinorhizobium sojae CCBAU 05684 TaxID=716928 RepID=A0A249PJ82_9HYPH|nr:hypothetical protein SJ05684_b47930 [Sinorhizobium sojae CCBAU 05684]
MSGGAIDGEIGMPAAGNPRKAQQSWLKKPSSSGRVRGLQSSAGE